MGKSKLISILKTFTDDEMKRFSDFISSPYFNSNKSLVRLFNLLRKYHPSFPEDKISKENLYGKLYTGDSYNDQVMRNLSSQLLKLTKEFISIESFNRDETQKSLTFLTEARLRRIDSIFNSEYKLLKSHFSKEKLDENLFHQMHELEDANVIYLIQRDRQKEVYDSLSKSGNSLIYYFLIRLSDIYINMKINQDTLNTDIEKEFVKEFFEDLDFEKLILFLENNKIEYGDIFILYYYRMLCILDPDSSENYFKLKELFLKLMGKLKKVEISQIIGTLEFVVTYKVNRRQREFYTELFGLYDMEIKYQVGQYSNNNKVTAFKFRNTVMVAIRVGELDWAHNYINKYRKKLNDESKELAEYAMGFLNFEKGEYEKSIEALKNIKTDYSLIKVDMKYLLIKAFYELGYEDSVISQLNSFRYLIGSQKQLTEITKEKGLNFINLTTNLVKLKFEPDKDKLSELLEKINSLSLTSDKEWLEKKVKELQSN